MTPINSNMATGGCSPVSSNCVIWQGPNIECISLCSGDSITEVVYKLAQELCALKTGLGLTDIDLGCLVEAGSADTADKSVRGVLTLLITKVCQAAEPTVPVVAEVVELTVAQCLRTNDTNGDPILLLPADEYIKTIGLRLCTLIGDYNGLVTTVNDHGARIVVLEGRTPAAYTLPTMISQCLLGNITPASIDVVLDALEDQFCALRTATGTATEISQAAAKQCANLGAQPAQSSAGTMSSLTGWKSPVTTLADSINNLWITVCDMRGSIGNLITKTTLGCSDIAVGFFATVSGEGPSWNARITFAGKTIIPSEFEECVSGAQLTIRDTSNHTYIVPIEVVSEKSNPAGVAVSLSASTLVPTEALTFTVEVCLTNGTVECGKIATVILPSTAVCSGPGSITASIV